METTETRGSQLLRRAARPGALGRVVRRSIRRAGIALVTPFERLILHNRYLPAKYFPFDRASPTAPVVLSGRAVSAAGPDGLPVPPKHLWLDYGNTAEEYLETGRKHVDTMLRLLQSGGADPAGFEYVLDVGCGAGRMLRAYPRAGLREIWGVDISAPHIEWCASHLSPPFHVATTTSIPHLPFEDSSFDLVWCGSVFTHIAELSTAWLLELRRIVRPHGWIYVTIDTKHSVALLTRLADDPDYRGFVRWLLSFQAFRDFARSSDFQLIIGTDPDSYVSYDAEGIVARWSQYLSVVSLTEEAYNCQAAVLMQKR